MISVLSRTWAAPSLLEYGDVNLMGSVTPKFPQSTHVFKDVKFQFESDPPMFCLVSPSIPLELGLFCLFRLLGAAMLMVVLTLCLGLVRDVELCGCLWRGSVSKTVLFFVCFTLITKEGTFKGKGSKDQRSRLCGNAPQVLSLSILEATAAAQ